MEIPSEGIIIIDTFINSLKEYITEKQSKSEENHILNLLSVLINFTLIEKNIQIFFEKRIIDILLVLVSDSQNHILCKSVALLWSICCIPSVEAKNTIIKKDIFNILHRRLSELSPSPPQQMKPDDYHSVSCIVGSVKNLLVSNPSGVIPFLNSPLIPVFSWTLESSMSLLNTSSDVNVLNIFTFVCESFYSCAELPYENIILFMEMKGGDLMLNVIEKYVEEIKQNNKRLNEGVVGYVSKTIYNVAANAFDNSDDGERNKMKNIFEENNKFNRMVDLCKYLISQPPSSPQQKYITNSISLAICFLLKSERPSPSLSYILSYVDNLKTSPPHPNDFIVSKSAKYALNNIVGRS
jgi:hypothetical protein